MSPAGDRPLDVPALGMLIDRTSFDVDDFGVDRAALELAEYNAGKDFIGVGNGEDTELPIRAVVMKDGKIRRRLRWRPKGMMKRRTPAKQGVIQTSGSSSNASVGSSLSGGNNSQYSSNSKKSFHSFASTETMVKSNTKKTSAKRFFPLPRPNYPKSFDGVATIGNEADMVHARMGVLRVSPLTLIADEDTIDEEKDDEGHYGSGPKTARTRNASESPSPAGVAASPRSNKPPLFRRRINSPKSTHVGSASPKVGQSPRSISMTIETQRSSPDINCAITAADEVVTPEQAEHPLPSLADDELEQDRRCDLRIPGPEVGDTREIRRNPVDAIFNLDSWRTEDPSSPLSIRSAGPGPARFRPRALRKARSFLAGTVRYSKSAMEAVPAEEGKPAVSQIKSDPIELGLEDLDTSDSSSIDEEYDMQKSLSPRSIVASESRFSMSETAETKSVGSKSLGSGLSTTQLSPSDTQEEKDEDHINGNVAMESRSKTGPVDVDDGSFLEVEKNLQAIHDMANEHLQHGEYDEASEVFEEILRGQLARYGEEHYRVGTAYHNIGIVSMKRRDYTQAINAYREAVRVRKSALGPEHADVAVSLAQLGVAYLESQRHRKAICVFREALKIRRRSLGNRHPKVAKILNNIGCALYDINELEVAMVAFLEALEIQRKLLRDSPLESLSLSENSLLSLASTQSNIASIKLYNGKFDEATVDLEEVLLIQQCVLGDEHPTVRKTQASLRWLEKWRNGSLNDDSLSLEMEGDDEVTRSCSADHKETMEILSMFDSFMHLQENLNIACGGGGEGEGEGEGGGSVEL